MRELRAVRGIEKTSPGFRRKVIEIADRNHLVADYLMSVMSFESAGSFDPAKRNAAGSSAIGLIQFLSSTAKTLGTSTAALAAMTAEAQLDYVEKYYQRVAPKGLDTLEDHYLVVLTGGRHAPDSVLFRDPYYGIPEASWPKNRKQRTDAYWQNRGFDTGGKGYITAKDATTPVRAIYDIAGTKLPIQVDMSAPVVEAATGSILLVALTGWTVIQIVMRVKGRHH